MSWTNDDVAKIRSSLQGHTLLPRGHYRASIEKSWRGHDGRGEPVFKLRLRTEDGDTLYADLAFSGQRLEGSRAFVRDAGIRTLAELTEGCLDGLAIVADVGVYVSRAGVRGNVVYSVWLADEG